MDNLIVLAGLLAVVRGYWTFNLIKAEKGEPKKSFFSFVEDGNAMSYCIIIRPFYKKKKQESLRKQVNIITYIIYTSLSLGIYYVTTK